MAEDEVVGWHHQLDGHEFEQVPGIGDGQGSLVCCSPWGHKELDTIESMNWPDRSLTLLTTSTLALFNSFSSNKPRDLFMVSFFFLIYMEFIKMVMMAQYVRQQKTHRCKEQTFGLCGRRQGWDDFRE